MIPAARVVCRDGQHLRLRAVLAAEKWALRVVVLFVGAIAAFYVIAVIAVMGGVYDLLTWSL
jgi:hypothetical protein